MAIPRKTINEVIFEKALKKIKSNEKDPSITIP